MPEKKKKSKEVTTQEEVVEDVADLDDAAALDSTATQQEAVMPTGGNVAEELNMILKCCVIIGVVGGKQKRGQTKMSNWNHWFRKLAGSTPLP